MDLSSAVGPAEAPAVSPATIGPPRAGPHGAESEQGEGERNGEMGQNERLGASVLS